MESIGGRHEFAGSPIEAESITEQICRRFIVDEKHRE